MLDKLTDLLLFRYTNQGKDTNNIEKPYITMGSIVWGGLVRTILIVVVSWTVVGYYELRDYWMVPLLAIVGLVIYPAYSQYQHFTSRIEVMQIETLCGSCKHFDPTNQLCIVYDEHVSTTYIPCEGDSWEPHTYEDRVS